MVWFFVILCVLRKEKKKEEKNDVVLSIQYAHLFCFSFSVSIGIGCCIVEHIYIYVCSMNCIHMQEIRRVYVD